MFVCMRIPVHLRVICAPPPSSIDFPQAWWTLHRALKSQDKCVWERKSSSKYLIAAWCWAANDANVNDSLRASLPLMPSTHPHCHRRHDRGRHEGAKCLAAQVDELANTSPRLPTGGNNLKSTAIISRATLPKEDEGVEDFPSTNISQPLDYPFSLLYLPSSSPPTPTPTETVSR